LDFYVVYTHDIFSQVQKIFDEISEIRQKHHFGIKNERRK